MLLSEFGTKFTREAGINSLMEDLGNALAGGDMIMMGGGNPGNIPEVQAAFQEQLARISADADEFRKLTGIYDPPQGEKQFIAALAELLSREYGWPIKPENIALTNGSQSAFFILFNMFAGRYPDGGHKRIMLPMTPEYIGYADAGLSEDFFVSSKPTIEMLDEHTFKYHVDFDHLNIDENVGAMCVSRPTNPTGNVLTDNEMARLIAMAKEHDVPLIVDGAYGLPFPDLVYVDAKPVWDEHLILCLSLSKLGLPAVRTGIVIAQPEIIKAVASVNAIVNLAPGSFGAMLTKDFVRSGEILRLSREVVKPCYQAKAEKAVATLHRELDGLPFALHKAEGAMFLWLWLRDFPLSSHELYQRLKQKGVLVVSGHYFFPGLQEEWGHTHECLRITYSQDEELVEKGLKIMAEEIRRLYADKS
ncbi:Alanine-alpha-ketoisovalerate/valine-pyruvate aminotransferase [Hahella chejuensis KCTC 2396]|uniref:Alanine-alpha-ketoisovalerate/valine-pyruvate aminotransferase n=1 Tax=Hahella chejuensis (strain KCTC 2396) TaxID=349521 RepID=Q2SKT6_HAHCH|nr:valine--pyruvate transaminase [Hahella chejuensis]ABC28738.1 Alanine-alpha-ketoisovalerate/valine-pyruvate aminotransferase [Hahella chejuensis KCTC 2396]